MGDDLVELAPIGAASLFQMVDFGRCARAPRNVDQFVDALDQAIAFGAHVADVHAAAFSGFADQRDQLVSFGEGRGRIDQRRPDAHRAFLHRLADEAAHAVELSRIGIDVALAQFMLPHRGRADERSDVERRALVLEEIEIVAKRGPFDRIFDVTLLLDRQRLHLVVERAHRPAFAHHFQRDPLAQLALPARVDEQRFIRPAQHVDEARRDRKSVRVDHSRRGRFLRWPGVNDSIAADADIADIGFGTAAVVDRPAADQDVVGRDRDRRERRHLRGRRCSGAAAYNRRQRDRREPLHHCFAPKLAAATGAKSRS